MTCRLLKSLFQKQYYPPYFVEEVNGTSKAKFVITLTTSKPLLSDQLDTIAKIIQESLKEDHNCVGLTGDEAIDSK